jgi:hypothetical protein
MTEEKTKSQNASRAPTSYDIHQGLANSSQNISGPPFVFVNKVLLEHGHAHSFTYYLWLLSYL